MTIIEPWDELGQTKEQFRGYLLDMIDRRIAEASACFHAARARHVNGQLAARPGHFDTASSFNWRRHDDAAPSLSHLEASRVVLALAAAQARITGVSNPPVFARLPAFARQSYPE